MLLLSYFMSQALESSFNEAFEAVPDHGVITITCSLPSGGDVGELWEAMENAELEEKHLRTVAGDLGCFTLTWGTWHPSYGWFRYLMQLYNKLGCLIRNDMEEGCHAKYRLVRRARSCRMSCVAAACDACRDTVALCVAKCTEWYSIPESPHITGRFSADRLGCSPGPA